MTLILVHCITLCRQRFCTAYRVQFSILHHYLILCVYYVTTFLNVMCQPYGSLFTLNSHCCQWKFKLYCRCKQERFFFITLQIILWRLNVGLLDHIVVGGGSDVIMCHFTRCKPCRGVNICLYSLLSQRFRASIVDTQTITGFISLLGDQCCSQYYVEVWDLHANYTVALFMCCSSDILMWPLQSILLSSRKYKPLLKLVIVMWV